MGTAVELLIAFLCAVLSGMGVGGGGLLLIYLTLVGGVEQRTAQLYNLVFFLAASVSSLVLHTLRRRIRIPVVLWLSLGGAAGAVAGSFFSRTVSDSVLGYILGGFLFCTGALSLFGGGRERESGKREEK